MAYLTLTELKRVLNTTGLRDEHLQAAIDAAQNFVEEVTGKVFEAAEVSTQTFYGIDVVEQELLFGGWLAEFPAEVRVNGQALALWDDYIPLPGKAPIFGIRFTNWLSFKPSDVIEVDGYWAYAKTPPSAVKQAVLELAVHFARAGERDREMLITPSGVVQRGDGIPATVWQLLQPYLRRPF